MKLSQRDSTGSGGKRRITAAYRGGVAPDRIDYDTKHDDCTAAVFFWVGEGTAGHM